MRNTLLKLAPWGALVAALGALSFWALDTNPLTSPPMPPAQLAAPATQPNGQSSGQPTAASAVPADDTTRQAGTTSTTTEPAALNAEELTARAKAQLALDPAGALHDIEQADRLAGAHDETRRALEIHALVRLGKVGLARTMTDRFYRAFPDSAHAAELERLTGYHPRPHGP